MEAIVEILTGIVIFLLYIFYTLGFYMGKDSLRKEIEANHIKHLSELSRSFSARNLSTEDRARMMDLIDSDKQ